MSEITMTARQIMNLGLWEKVCEYKDWNPYILNEGRIDEDELITFDDSFEKQEEVNKTGEDVGLTMLEHMNEEEIRQLINECVYTGDISKLADIARELLNDLYRNE